jgi:hypothetical protein
VERGCGGVQAARLPEVRVDRVIRAESTNLRHGVAGRPHEPEPFAFTTNLNEGLELGPPAQDKSSVATAGPAAANIGLKEHHGDRGFEFLDSKCGPEARVPAADDANVGLVVAADRGRKFCPGLQRKRFLQPQ